MPAFNRASHLVSIRARSGQSHRLGLRLQELAQAGQAAPGCLRYELRQADGDSDLWLLHSEWSDDAAMQAYLAGDAQRVFAEVLWPSAGGDPGRAGAAVLKPGGRMTRRGVRPSPLFWPLSDPA
ncbi:antibiotic biosynthesis monooxygenase family protein [Pseudomonas aeruginosa]|uniref:antibiotic biosynthesis monooxygenase family protein n=2 Tax=Gammaproteobacteria TaxID=1236 RepID=UPI00374A25CC